MWISLFTIVLHYSLKFWDSSRRPAWLQTFATEEQQLAKDEESSPDSYHDEDEEIRETTALLPERRRARTQLKKNKTAEKAWTSWTLAIFFLNVVSVALGVLTTSAAASRSEGQMHAQLNFIPVVPSVSFFYECSPQIKKGCLLTDSQIISAFIIAVDRPMTFPGPSFAITAALFIVELAILTIAPESVESTWPSAISLVGGMLTPFITLAVMVNMPLRDPRWNSDDIGKPFERPKSTVRSPEDIVTMWQWMTVSWIAPLMSLGYNRQLHDEDVWFLAYEFQHSRLHLLFRELKGTVFARLLKANGRDIIITTSLSLLETTGELFEPVLLKLLLGALMAVIPDRRAALVYAGLILANRLARAQSGVWNLWYQRRNYERSRGEMITMIYEKTLRRKAFTFASDGRKVQETIEEPTSSSNSTNATLADEEAVLIDGGLAQHKLTSSSANRVKTWFRFFSGRLKSSSRSAPEQDMPDGPASTGKILNLLRGDVYEVAQRFWDFHQFITRPYTFLLSIVLVWKVLGPASLSGILVLIAGMCINIFFIRLQLKLEIARRRVTDSKLQQTSQFVESIRHLRWYDWQDAWLTRIMDTRHYELVKRVQSNVTSKTINSINALAAYMFPVVAFFTYTLVSGQPLTVDVAFPALTLFGMVQSSLRELPNIITILLNARVAMGRIERFMLEPDKEVTFDQDRPDTVGPPGELKVTIKGASFSWPGSTRTVLRDVSIECEPGLTVVCGRVGIGKTALLHAILGELDQHGGEKTVPREMIGYSAQSPWLESMSIRENILFCTAYDEERYWQVLDACCLTEDINKFKGRDLSLVGENGIGLSGGQRARVALARAIYSRARILLLDDPIAALDHQTAESILGNLFADRNSPLTAGRMVIFVTHRVDITTPYAYQILDIVDGGHVKTLHQGDLGKDEEKELQELAAATAAKKQTSRPPSREGDGDAPDKFIEEEYRAHGGVMASVYWKYIKSGRLGWWTGMITLYVVYRVANVAYFWFLKEWGEGYKRTSAGVETLEGNKGWIDLDQRLPPPGENVRPWLLWFLVISLVQVLLQVVADVALIVIVYNAGKNLFAQAIERVSNATFRFYDVTPVGRLMNRLTSDMGTVDGPLADQLVAVAYYIISWSSSMFVIASATPVFLVLSLLMTAVFVVIFNRFLPTSQSLRRLETVSLSPLMSNFGTLLEGLTTVRAFKAEPHFQNRIITTTDAFQKMDHIYWSVQAWLQYRFDLLSAITTYMLTLTAIYSGLTSGTVGFVLAAASNFVLSTHNLCRKYGEMQMQFVSVERVIELLDLEQEANNPDNKPPAAWPTYTDSIVFDNVTLRYAPNLDPVLVGASFEIPGGSSVAVTGRTGSGKSTLAVSLLGTIHPDPVDGGSIRIGNVDLARVDKHTLRRNITFVAQDPVLFPGTLRDNLDPLNEHTEGERAEVLQRVLGHNQHMPSSSSSMSYTTPEFTLDSRVDGGGKNLSQGQRQLVGLGRAILRRSPVVIMDEATASIDVATAAKVHALLRKELKHSTVITIAHKAEAVADADFEIVLDKGRVVRAGPRVKK